MEQLGPGVEEKENPNMFLVGATWQRLLSGAEEVGLFKEFSDGSMRAFTCANKHNFKDFKGKGGGCMEAVTVSDLQNTALIRFVCIIQPLSCCSVAVQRVFVVCGLCLQGTGTASSVWLSVSTSLNTSWTH